MIIKRKSEKYTTTKIYFRKNKLRKACLEIMQLKGERIFRKVWKRTFEESKLEINQQSCNYFNRTTSRGWLFSFQSWQALFLHHDYGYNHWSAILTPRLFLHHDHGYNHWSAEDILLISYYAFNAMFFIEIGVVVKLILR